MANEFKIKNGLVSDGNIVVTGSITATEGINISGSIASAETASFAPSYTLSSSFNSYTSSASSSVGSLSSSVATTTSGLASRIGSVETKTGSYATTGSNIFVGSQVITGSLYITNDMVVQGCSCLQNITASAVSIGTNTVILNTATPAVRFAGVSVQDSGSNAGVTGSIYWDGLCNRWVYSNPSGIGYSGGMLLSGPRTSTLGSESPLTCNYIAKSGGGDHLYDSCIIGDGTTVCVNAKLEVRSSDLNNIFVTNPDTTGTTTGSGIGFRAYNGTSVAQAAGIILTSNTWSYGTYSANQLSIGVDGTGGLALRSANSAPISFFTGGDTAGLSTEKLRITNTGLVGINETSPASIGTGYGALTVGGCSGGGINLKINNNATVPGQIWANSTDMVFKTNGSKPFTFYTDDTMAVKIASGGNVGIGTISPAVPLQIRDCTVSSGGSAIHAYGYDGAANFYTSRGEDPYNAAIYLYNNPTSGRGYGTGILFRAKSDTTVSQVQGGIHTTWTTATDASRTSKMVFSTVNSGTNSEKLTISGTGIACFSNNVCAPIVARCGSKWQLNGSIDGGNNACALVINIDNSRAVRVRGIVTGIGGQTMTSLGMYEAIVYRLGGGAGNESKRFAVLVDCNASPGNAQGIKMDVIGDTLYIQNKTSMSYSQSIVAWAEIFYA
jgi:hypothetical protein